VVSVCDFEETKHKEEFYLMGYNAAKPGSEFEGLELMSAQQIQSAKHYGPTAAIGLNLLTELPPLLLLH
jgi:hypothetical protein